MEPMEWIALIGGILSLFGMASDYFQTRKANKMQMEHDEAMAALNHRYREEEAISSQQREVSLNEFQIAKDKMLSAGISPSLMYGGGFSPTSIQSSSVGSSQSAGNVGRTPNISDFLGKLDPLEYTSQTIDRMNAVTMQERTRMQNRRDAQDIRESISRTLENKRKTAFNKKLEQTLLDQEDQTLKNLKIEGDQRNFDLQYSVDTREIRMEKERLQNKEMEKKIDILDLEINREPLVRAQIATDIQRMKAMTENYNANTNATVEQTKGMAVSRVMREFGLTARSIPVNARAGKIHDALWKDNMDAARIALKQLGFSEFEATNAVLWYVAEDPKDVTPSLVNGVTRWLSSATPRTVFRK